MEVFLISGNMHEFSFPLLSILSFYIYKALCTCSYFLSSNINLIYLSLSGLEFHLSSTSPLYSVLGTRHSALGTQYSVYVVGLVLLVVPYPLVIVLSRPLSSFSTSGFVLLVLIPCSFDSYPRNSARPSSITLGTRLGLVQLPSAFPRPCHPSSKSWDILI